MGQIVREVCVTVRSHDFRRFLSKRGTVFWSGISCIQAHF